jgi:hypothetical protein
MAVRPAQAGLQEIGIPDLLVRPSAGKAEIPEERKTRLHPVPVLPCDPYRHALRLAYKLNRSREKCKKCNASFSDGNPSTPCAPRQAVDCAPRLFRPNWRA